MLLARAADAVVRRLVPKVDAVAACRAGCVLRFTRCQTCRPRQTEYYYNRSSNCVWGAPCLTRICGNFPCE